jgi:hypothetical protein
MENNNFASIAVSIPIWVFIKHMSLDLDPKAQVQQARA